MTTYSTTARCSHWGSRSWNARHVTHLTREERAAIRAGADVRMTGCPEYRGTTERRIVSIKGRFYARMPQETTA